MAELVRFEQDEGAPPGAGLFHFDTGQSIYAYEPEEAKRLGERIAAAPNPMVAGPPVDVWYDDPGDPVDRATGRAMPPAAPPPPPQAAPAGPSPAERVPAGPSTDELAVAAREKVRRQAAEELTHGKLVSTPSRNPERERETGVMVPKGSTVSTEGARPYDPEMARQRVEADRKVLDVQLAGLNAQEQTFRAQAARAAAEQPELERQAAEAQSYRARAIEGFRRKRAALAEDLREYEMSAKPDPQRFFSDRGVLGSIGMVIAQALGAYAATMSGGPNWAKELIDDAIDRDIDAQREEIRLGRASRENALARYTEFYGGDIEQAEEAVRIAQLKASQNEVRRYAAEAQIPQMQHQAQLMVAELERDVVNREQQWFNNHMGKTTTSVQQEFIQPQAGGVGRRPLTAAEQEAALKRLGPGDVVDELKPKDRVALDTKYGERKQDILEGRQSIDELANTYGLKVNWDTGETIDLKTGKLADPDTWEGISGHGVTGSVPGIVTSREGRNIRAQQLKSIMAYKKAVTGTAATAQEAKDTREVIVGTYDTDALAGLQRMVSEVQNKDKELDATFPAEIVEGRRQRQRQVNVERKQRGATAPKVTPYGE